jgi:hypothetical protein
MGLKVRCCVHKSPPLDPTVHQFNPISTHISYFLNTLKDSGNYIFHIGYFN